MLGGNFYGTTASGGQTGCSVYYPQPAGCGTIFEIVPSGSGYEELNIHDFSAANGKSRLPSGLAAVAGSTLYGTTNLGGNCPTPSFPDGCGTIFSITSAGDYSVVYEFQGPITDGANPKFGTLALKRQSRYTPGLGAFAAGPSPVLAVGSNGSVWGATTAGGTGACGDGGGCGTIYVFNTGARGSHRRR